MSPARDSLGNAALETLDFASEVGRIGMWHWDLATDRVALDSHTAKTLALPREVSGESLIQQGIQPEHQVRFRAAIQRALSADGVTSERIVLRSDALAPQAVDLQLKAVRDGAAKACQLLLIALPADPHTTSQLESRLAHSERALIERLSVATQAAGIYVWEFDWLKGAISWDENRLTRKGANRHFGQEFGSEFFKYVHPEDRGIGMTAMQTAVAAGESDASFRYRLRLADETMRHIQAYARTYTDAAGKPLRSVGVSWDVTAEVAAAEQLEQQAQALRAAQRRLERASLSIQEGHWEIDWLASKHWGSASYYALLGYGPDEIEFDTFEKLEGIVHPEDRVRGRAANDRHLQDGSPLYDVELRIAVKQGGYRWFRLRGSAERDASGRVIRMAGSIQDIHRQREVEAALGEAQARFDRAVKGTQDGLWEADMVRGSMWLSPRAHALLGYEEGELHQGVEVLRERMHPEELAANDEALNVTLAQGLDIDREMRLRRKDGLYRWFRVRATPTVTDGVMRCMSGCLQDVTEAHEARNALLQATEAAQAASQAKSAFLANVSHEIRTPMNGIIGMTSLMLDTSLDRTQRDYADTIRSSADSLLTVINDLLDFSKIEAGKLDIERIEMDLTGSVEDVGATLAFQAAAKNLELVINVQPDVPASVLGDPQRIRQCLVNLIGNAIKFTSIGEIAVDVSRVGGDPAHPLIRFEVRDSGIGISAEAAQKLFQPFVQADASTTRNFGGTGLGLSIVRRLVELMGGEIGVQSEPNKGSRFWFVLPLPVAELRAAVAADVNTARNASHACRILIVDDNETNRRVVATRLAHAGYDVALASSGREALVTLQIARGSGRGFDVVLSDQQMPEMDGAALGERILGDSAFGQTRVVLLTSVDRHGDLSRFASMGFAGYLTKPIRMRELLACIDKVLSRNPDEWHARSYPMVTTSSLHETGKAKPFSGHVLLVEDNVVNQKVGQRFLERLGCRVTVAENGAKAIQAWQSGEFRLVLMDVQMPVMDGYTATREIRALEGTRPRTPIVALTANAMSGQLERCLQSGMDDLLTKPLDPQELEEVLERFGFGTRDHVLHEPQVDALLDATDGRGAIDIPAFQEVVADDHAFARSLAQEYSRGGRDLLSRMREAFTRRELPELARLAHQLKGASANICASRMAAACARLEGSLTRMSAADTSKELDALERELEWIEASLQCLTSVA
jgi:two-component system, sensor histidine kinase and response regulator